MSHTDIKHYRPGTIKYAATQRRPAGNQGTKTRVKYKDLIVTFDIETTRLLPEEQAIMYVWQLHIAGENTFMGRTWAELEQLFFEFSMELEPDERLVIWVHNLSYEAVFLRAVHEWEAGELFWMDARKIAKATWTEYRLEFRCSYIHSNMSLAEYCAKMHVQHAKLSGDEFDYSRERLPWTELTPLEYEYCENDVIGLAEALEAEMKMDGDNLYTIPMTATGYVRRNAKKAMRKSPPQLVKNMLPDVDLYLMLREAFRGGNTHANRYYAGGISSEEHWETDPDADPPAPRILYGVQSADRSSSYPDTQCNDLFPMSEFHRMDPCTNERVLHLLGKRQKAMLMRVAFSGIRLQDPRWGCPYIPRDKCRRLTAAAYDNGRVLTAEYLEITVTDIDLEIILAEYAYDDMTIFDAFYARYGRLPEALIQETINYYEGKTRLKTAPTGVTETESQTRLREMMYGKYKAWLNSVYGMSATNPVRISPVYCDGSNQRDDSERELYQRGDWMPPLPVSGSQEEQDAALREYIEDKLTDYRRSAFMPYQWGVWVTAWARLRLEEGIRMAHGLTPDGKRRAKIPEGEKPPQFVYCDTDSVKYTGYIDWDPYNRKRRAASEKHGAYATDPQGTIHYMGEYEREKSYYQFATMGAKKYAYTYEPGGETHVTIAGVTKRKGGKELDAHGGLSAFRDGFTFVDAGGVEAIYNDHPEIKYVERQGRRIYIHPNIVLRPSTYTLGVADDYRRLLLGIAEYWAFDIDI